MSSFTYNVESGEAIQVQLVDEHDNLVVNQPISVMELMERGTTGVDVGNGYTVQLEDVLTEEDEEEDEEESTSSCSSTRTNSSDMSPSFEEEEVEDEVVEGGFSTHPRQRVDVGAVATPAAITPPPSPPPGTQGVSDWYGVMNALRQESTRSSGGAVPHTHAVGDPRSYSSMIPSSATPLQVVDRNSTPATGGAVGVTATASSPLQQEATATRIAAAVAAAVTGEAEGKDESTTRARRREANARREVWASLAPEKTLYESHSLTTQGSRSFRVLQFVSVMRHLSTRQFRPSALSMHASTSYCHPRDRSQRILVYGGITGGGRVVEQEMYEFSLLSCAWKRLEGKNFVPAGHFGHTLTATPSSIARVVVVGGIGPGGLLFHFSEMANDPYKVARADALLYLAKLEDSRVLRAPSLSRPAGSAVGGGGGGPPPFSSRIGFVPLVFDMHVQRLEWRAIQLAHPLAIAFHTTISYEEEMFIFGGITKDGEVSNQLLVLNAETFAVRLIMPSSFNNSGLQGHLSGGANDGNATHHDDVEQENSMSSTPVAPPARFLHSAVRYGHYFIIHGGFDEENKPLSDTWAFDMIHERWELLPIASGEVVCPPRAGHAAVVVGHRMMVVGGYHCPLEQCLAQGLEKSKRPRVMELNLIPSLEGKTTHRRGSGHGQDGHPLHSRSSKTTSSGTSHSGNNSTSSNSSIAATSSTTPTGARSRGSPSSGSAHHWRVVRTQPVLPPLAFSTCESCGDHFSFFLFGGLLTPPSKGKGVQPRGSNETKEKKKKALSSSSSSSSSSFSGSTDASDSESQSQNSHPRNKHRKEKDKDASYGDRETEGNLRLEKSLSAQLVTLDDAIILRFPLKSEERNRNGGASSSSGGGEADLSVPPRFKPFVKRQEDFLKKKYFNIDEVMRKTVMQEKEAMEPTFYLKPEEIELLIQNGEKLCETLTSYPLSELPVQLPDRALRVKISENMVSLARQARDVLKSMKASEVGVTAVKSKTHRHGGGQKLVDYSAAKPFRRFVITAFLKEIQDYIKEVKALNKSLHEVVWEEKDAYIASVAGMQQGVDQLSHTITRIMSHYVNSRVKKLFKSAERHKEVMKTLTAAVEKSERDKIWGVQDASDQRRVAARGMGGGGRDGSTGIQRFVYPGRGRGIADPPLPLLPPPARSMSAKRRAGHLYVGAKVTERKRQKKIQENSDESIFSSSFSSPQGAVTRLTEKDCEKIQHYLVLSKKTSAALLAHCRNGISPPKEKAATAAPAVEGVEQRVGVGLGGWTVATGAPDGMSNPIMMVPPVIAPGLSNEGTGPSSLPSPPPPFLSLPSPPGAGAAAGSPMQSSEARTTHTALTVSLEAVTVKSNALREEVMGCTREVVTTLRNFSREIRLNFTRTGADSREVEIFSSSSSYASSSSSLSHPSPRSHHSSPSSSSRNSFSSSSSSSSLSAPTSHEGHSSSQKTPPHHSPHHDHLEHRKRNPRSPARALGDVGFEQWTDHPSQKVVSPSHGHDASSNPISGASSSSSSSTSESCGGRLALAYREVPLRVVEPLFDEKKKLGKISKKAQGLRAGPWNVEDLGAAPTSDAKMGTLIRRLENYVTALIQLFTASFLSIKGARPPNAKVRCEERPPIRQSRHLSPPPTLTAITLRSSMASRTGMTNAVARNIRGGRSLRRPSTGIRNKSSRQSPLKNDPEFRDAILAHRKEMMMATMTSNEGEQERHEKVREENGVGVGVKEGEEEREVVALPQLHEPSSNEYLFSEAHMGVSTRGSRGSMQALNSYCLSHRNGTESEIRGIGARVMHVTNGKGDATEANAALDHEHESGGVIPNPEKGEETASAEGALTGEPAEVSSSPPPSHISTTSSPPVVVPVASFEPLHVLSPPPAPIAASTAVGPVISTTPAVDGGDRTGPSSSFSPPLPPSPSSVPSYSPLPSSDASIPPTGIPITPIYPGAGGVIAGVGSGLQGSLVPPAMGIPIPSGVAHTAFIPGFPASSLGQPQSLVAAPPLSYPAFFYSPMGITPGAGVGMTLPTATGVQVTPSGGVVVVQPPTNWAAALPASQSTPCYSGYGGPSPPSFAAAASAGVEAHSKVTSENHCHSSFRADDPSTLSSQSVPPLPSGAVPAVSFGPSTFMIPGRGSPPASNDYFHNKINSSSNTMGGGPFMSNGSSSGSPSFSFGVIPSSSSAQVASAPPTAAEVSPIHPSSAPLDPDYFYFGQPTAHHPSNSLTPPPPSPPHTTAAPSLSSASHPSAPGRNITALPPREISVPLGTVVYHHTGVIPNTPRKARQRSASRPQKTEVIKGSRTTISERGASSRPQRGLASPHLGSSSYGYEGKGVSGVGPTSPQRGGERNGGGMTMGKPRVLKSNMTIGERRILEARERLRGK